LAYWPALVAAGELLRERGAQPRAQLLDMLLYALALTILARTALWYSPDDLVGRVFLPLAPLLALFIVGAFLMRALREPRAEQAAGHARV
jgi:fatty acid desaturase